MSRYDERSMEYYKSLIADWAMFDAQRVVCDGDTRGKWARMRLDTITGFKNRMFSKEPVLARQLYEGYLELLNAEIKKLDGNKVYRRYGTVPVFSFNERNRVKDRKITVV